MGPRWLVAAACVAALSAGLAAHDRKSAGALQLVIGWSDEPAFAGARNAVVVSVSDRKGPVTGATGSLAVEITFAGERLTLPLTPVPERPHEFQASLVPTRAGTYTFRVTGRLNEQVVDVSSTCSASTFHCVVETTDIQFPVKDPTVAQLATRLDRALPRAEGAGEQAAQTRTIAIAALVISLVGVAVATVAAVGARRSRA